MKIIFILLAVTMQIYLLDGQVNHTIHLANCSITAPDTLRYSMEEVKSKLGKLELHRYRYTDRVQGSQIKYILQYCDYPAEALHQDSTELLEEFFEVTAESSASSVFGNLEYSQTVDLHGYPGMIWRISFDRDKALIKSHAFVKGRRFYNLSVHYPRDLGYKNAIDIFFNSFKIIE